MATRSLPILIAGAISLCASAQSKNADESFGRGSRLAAEGKTDAALNAFQQTVQLRPEHAAAWKAIGVILASRGEYDGAEGPFRNACELQRSLADACLYYGRTLYLLNRFLPAVE